MSFHTLFFSAVAKKLCVNYVCEFKKKKFFFGCLIQIKQKMPSILSKFFSPEWNVPYNCYEMGHGWTPYCSAAALEIGLIVFQQSLKLYAPLYLVCSLYLLID